MLKICSITGMGSFTDPKYADITVDMSEIGLEAAYSFEGLTRN